jgi:hypothetical protein
VLPDLFRFVILISFTTDVGPVLGHYLEFRSMHEHRH